MKKMLLAASVLLVSLGIGNAYADPALRVGVIDLQQIMQKSSQIAAMNSSLTKEFKPRQDKILATQKQYQDETDQLNRNSATMAEADRNKLQDRIFADRANLQGMMMSFQRDVETARTQAQQKFMDQLNTVVNNVAKAKSFDLILQRAAAPYVKSDLDLTNEVLDQLNKG